MADKAVWSDANVRHFIEAGNRPLGMFTSTGWKKLVTNYEGKTKLKQTKKQLKNKLDNMRKEYTWFMEFKNCATDLGWDEAKQTVVCYNEWWDEHLARCNNLEKGTKCNNLRFRKQGSKHLDDLYILFDKVHVTGASASCPGDISSDDSSDDDEVAEVQKTPDNDDVKLAALKKSKPGKRKCKECSAATEEKDKKSPFFRLYKSTCMKIGTAAQKISTSVEGCKKKLSSCTQPSS